MKLQALSLLCFLMSCSTVHSRRDSVVLVHGAHFSGNSFNRLKAELKRENVYAVDLPSGIENAQSATLKSYGRTVCEFIKNLSHKSVLVGHSQGGAVINEAFGACPEKIKGFIYIAATIPLTGEKAFSLFGPQDDEYYFRAIEEDKEKGLFIIKDREAFLEAFIPDGTSTERTLVRQIAHDEPVSPANDALGFDQERYRSMKKLVILTTKDRVISLKTQEAYSTRLENTEVIRLESGHLPMMTQPKTLSNAIVKFLNQSN